MAYYFYCAFLPLEFFPSDKSDIRANSEAVRDSVVFGCTIAGWSTNSSSSDSMMETSIPRRLTRTCDDIYGGEKSELPVSHIP